MFWFRFHFMFYCEMFLPIATNWQTPTNPSSNTNNIRACSSRNTKYQFLNLFQKFLAVFVVAIACASADVSHLKDDASAPIVRSDYEISPEGAFQFVYETGNGIYGQANGVVKNPNSVSYFVKLKQTVLISFLYSFF